MKVIVNGVTFPLVEFETNTKNIYIYTHDNIYINHNKALHKVEFKDEKIDIINYKGYEFLVDYTKQIPTDIINHIPYYHLCCEETIHTKLIDSSIILIKNTYFDQISYYFEIDILNNTNYDKIISFLSSK